MSYLSIDPNTISKKDLHQFVIGAISPRPIALVSTINLNGVNNLAPYSFFNAFSSTPPIVIFSANLIGQPPRKKHTLKNVEAVPQCVINLVNYDILRQMTLCSVEFEEGISEFEKAGLTPLEADLVEPKKVKEAFVQIECTVENIIALGIETGAAQLVISKILKMHISKSVMDEQLRRIDPQKLDIVGRLGRSNYVRVNGNNIESVYQSTSSSPLGFDQLPTDLLNSEVLTGNELAAFAALTVLPTEEEIEACANKHLLPKFQQRKYYHDKAKKLIAIKDFENAIKIALYKG